jgi:putative NADH-flavin reductase
MLSANPAAIELLKQHPNKIDWVFLSKNSNHEAIEMLKANPTKFSWYYLCGNRNPEAIEMLRANPSKIDWNFISQNPNIFVYDYEKIAKRISMFHEELIAKALHPSRIAMWLENGMDYDDL